MFFKSMTPYLNAGHHGRAAKKILDAETILDAVKRLYFSISEALWKSL